MAFPVVLQGAEGEQYNTYTDARWPLGTQLVLQDGRKYRFASAGGSTLVVGNVIQSAANVANHVDTTAVASAINASSPQTTLGATAATINQYAQGYAVVTTTPDGARTYKIDNHAAVLSAGILTANLVSGYAIKAAWTTSSRVSLIKNPFDSVIQEPATTITAGVVGIAQSAPTTTNWGWLQTAGTAAVLQSGTLVLGAPAAAIQVAGAAGPLSATIATTVTQPVIGRVQQVSAGTWSVVNLTLD